MECRLEDERCLWDRLQQFSFDAQQSAVTFSRRLQQENGWSRAYTLRAIEEYRRFLFLAATGDVPVTPSDQVDQVWHLHLCYTRSYWQELCEKTVGIAIHHGPTRGGTKEQQRFAQQYEQTLARYRQVFDSSPPADIWPAAGERFRPRRWQRVDVGEAIRVPRGAALAVAVTVPLSLLLLGCSKGGAGDAVVGVLVAVAILGLFVWLCVRTARAERRSGNPTSGCGGDGAGFGGSHGHDSRRERHGEQDGEEVRDGDIGDAGGDSGCGGGGCGGGD